MDLNLSLNEVAATAKKAARGAGYSWGMAEEAAAAVRWLAASGIEGCAPLVALLDQADGAPENHRPNVAGPIWQASGSGVCPLAAGTALADHSTGLVALQTRIADVMAPVLLLACAADAARMTGRAVSVACGTEALTTDGTRLGGTSLPERGDVDISFGGALETPRAPMSRATPAPEVWAALNAFAERTYAPASEASRLMGAGAGTNDND